MKIDDPVSEGRELLQEVIIIGERDSWEVGAEKFGVLLAVAWGVENRVDVVEDIFRRWFVFMDLRQRGYELQVQVRLALSKIVIEG